MSIFMYCADICETVCKTIYWTINDKIGIMLINIKIKKSDVAFGRWRVNKKWD